MTVNKFNLPDVGEGLTEAEIVSWNVKPGDSVAINDILCEIETAKSLVELPSPFAGTVTELLVPVGVTVDVGTPIISVSDAVSGDPTPADAPVPVAPAAAAAQPPAAPAADAPMYGKLSGDQDEQENGTSGEQAAPASGKAVGPLVGSGPKADAVKRRPRKASPSAAVRPAPAAATPALVEPAPWPSLSRPRASGSTPAHLPPPAPPTPRRFPKKAPGAPPSAAPSAAWSTGSWPSLRCARSPATSGSTSQTSSPPVLVAKSPGKTW